MESTTGNEPGDEDWGIQPSHSLAPNGAMTPDQDARLARLRGERTPLSSPTGRSTAARRRGKRHPAGHARTVALVASVTATAGIGTAMAYSDAVAPAPMELEVGAAASAVGAPVPTTAPIEMPTTADPQTTEAPEATTEPQPTAAPTTEAQPTEAAASITEPQPEAQPTETPASVASTEPEPTATGLADGVFVGSAEYTKWGDVQVQVTITDGRLVNIVSLQMPSSRKSAQINNAAEPVLESQAIATQSADLDVVSGATSTSHTYEDSLQAALDQAALAASRSVAVGQ